MENSKIEWTKHTLNLWHGCTKVHAGCDNCYAEALSHRFNDDVWGNDKQRKPVKKWRQSLATMQAKAKADNTVELVFTGSMMDIFEKSMPMIGTDRMTGDERYELFQNITMGLYPNLFFLLLTKRPSNIFKMIPECWISGSFYPANVAFGVSVSDQKSFREYTNALMTFRSMVGARISNFFYSIEPQLSLIDISDIDRYKVKPWIIQGGESGPNKRPFDLDWAYTIKAQCENFKFPYFFKQIDKVRPVPDDLMVREFPDYYTLYRSRMTDFSPGQLFTY